MDEAEMIRAAQAGDTKAFEQLVGAYDQGVLRLALNLLRSPEDARDVYQETFLRAFRSLHTYRHDASFQTWLYKIASNLCLDHLRRRRIRREESTVEESNGNARDRAETIPEQRPEGDPVRSVFSSELRSRIEEVLSEMTPRERLVFELRHYEGMRLRAIGDVLGTTEEAAKNCLFRVTQKMRAALGDFV